MRGAFRIDQPVKCLFHKNPVGRGSILLPGHPFLLTLLRSCYYNNEIINFSLINRCGNGVRSVRKSGRQKISVPIVQYINWVGAIGVEV